MRIQRNEQTHVRRQYAEKLDKGRAYPPDTGLEHNVAVGEERLNNQAKLLKAWAPVVHGEWVYDEFDIPHCSECGHEVMPNLISPFCQNCGAKMDGEELQNNE